MLSAARKEHKSPAYLALSPRGTVPTLQSDDLTLGHSIAIFAWLDRAYPDKPIFGDTPQEAGQIWQDTMEIFDHLPAATSALLSPIFFDGANKPTDSLSEAVDRLLRETRHLTNLLTSQPWMSGERPGAADAVAFPHIRLIERAMETQPEIMNELGLPNLRALSPEIADWVARIEALPNVAQTFPPHWVDAA